MELDHKNIKSKGKKYINEKKTLLYCLYEHE
jgi:hypothetical protein